MLSNFKFLLSMAGKWWETVIGHYYDFPNVNMASDDWLAGINTIIKQPS